MMTEDKKFKTSDLSKEPGVSRLSFAKEEYMLLKCQSRLKTAIYQGEKMKEKEYFEFYKSVLDQDRNAIVICNLDHEIIYMNPAAARYYEK